MVPAASVTALWSEYRHPYHTLTWRVLEDAAPGEVRDPVTRRRNREVERRLPVELARALGVTRSQLTLWMISPQTIPLAGRAGVALFSSQLWQISQDAEVRRIIESRSSALLTCTERLLFALDQEAANLHGVSGDEEARERLREHYRAIRDQSPPPAPPPGFSFELDVR